MQTPRIIELLTVRDLADLFQVRTRKILDLVRDDGLPHVRVGRAYRFRRADVDRWLADRTEAIPRLGASQRRAEVPNYDWAKPRI